MKAGSRVSFVWNFSLKVARRLVLGARSILGIPREYRFGDISVLLPPYHALWLYQAENPRYDRFLPHLARALRSEDVIVDIGANVGDSLAGMAEQNSRSTYVCIEADEVFFRYLTDNINRIKRQRPELRVHTIRALVGKTVSAVTLKGEKGTKSAVVMSDGGVSSTPLDEIFQDLPGVGDVRLLKIDVDGFDYDVIASSMALIKRCDPLIFFECDYRTEIQSDGFRQAISDLKDCGYCDWTVFDNFGEVMFQTSDSAVIAQLLDYIWHQNQGRATRTIYYLDLLASRVENREWVNTIVSSYKVSL